MRLTKTLKQAFVKRVMDDVPKEDYIEKIRSVFLKGAIDILPEPVRKLYRSEHSAFVRTVYFTGSIRTSGYTQAVQMNVPGVQKDYPYNYSQNLADFAPKPCKAEVEALAEKHLQQTVKLKALQTKLEGVANSATTVANLKKLLPEFSKYLPSDSETIDRSVPAITNLVSDFSAAGWPKDTPKNPAT